MYLHDLYHGKSTKPNIFRFQVILSKIGSFLPQWVPSLKIMISLNHIFKQKAIKKRVRNLVKLDSKWVQTINGNNIFIFLFGPPHRGVDLWFGLGSFILKFGADLKTHLQKFSKAWYKFGASYRGKGYDGLSWKTASSPFLDVILGPKCSLK